MSLSHFYSAEYEICAADPDFTGFTIAPNQPANRFPVSNDDWLRLKDLGTGNIVCLAPSHGRNESPVRLSDSISDYSSHRPGVEYANMGGGAT